VGLYPGQSAVVVKHAAGPVELLLGVFHNFEELGEVDYARGVCLRPVYEEPGFEGHYRFFSM
jgi:hypothetical protein